MLSYIKNAMPKKHRKIIYEVFLEPFAKKYKPSFAQSGEDILLSTILCEINKGFYVDVGANNPVMQSNTNYFYISGWNGINIDAMPGSMQQFNKYRPRDINLEIPISDKEEILKFYMFSSSFYNTFSEELAKKVNEKMLGIIELKTQRLSQVLDQYLHGNEIDFLSVDVEGWDLKVLKSNDWNKYRPKVVLIEYTISNKPYICDTKIGKYLVDQEYVFMCNTLGVFFFLECDFYKKRFEE